MNSLPDPHSLKQEIVQALQCARPGCPCAKGELVHCPAHDDAKPSLSLTVRNGRLLVHCHAGCTQRAVTEALQARGLWPGLQMSLTLEELAAAKRLPVDSLQPLGLRTAYQHDKAQVRIPYMDEQGEVVAIRFRKTLEGAERFSWRRGDKPLLYGLWRLREVRAAGWVLLVEGESDCLTAWLHGVPALGIPGKGTWRPEWARYLHGLQVILWLEPDAADLVERVARDIPGLRVILPPVGFKDLSDAHVQGEDVPALVGRLRREAMPAADALREQEQLRRHHEAASALRDCAGLLDYPHLLDRVDATLSQLGLAGDKRNAILLYLAFTSRLLDRPVNVAVDGPSAVGKNYLVSRVLALFPSEAAHPLTASSERFLAFAEEDFRHRFVVIGEAAGLHRDGVGATILRTIAWDGRMVYQTVEKTEHGLRPRRLEKPGPTGFITTTTKPLEPELATRVLTISVRDDPEQSRLVVLEAGRRAAKGSARIDVAPFVATQRWLAVAGVCEVVVPFGEKLAELVDARSVRVRRDFTQLLTLVQASALLFQRQRGRDTQGRVIATVADYAIVYGLTAELFAATLTDGLTAAQREAVNAVLALSEDTEEDSQRGVSLREVARHLGIDRSAASRRLARAAEKGYVINLEDRKGRPARYVPGEHLPDPRPAIPTPEALAKACEGVCSYPPENQCNTATPPSEAADRCSVAGVSEGVHTHPSDGEASSECPSCGGAKFWRSVFGKVSCAVCHPPAVPALVAEWIGS